MRIYCTGVGVVLDAASNHIDFTRLMEKQSFVNAEINKGDISNFSSKKFRMFTENAFKQAISDADLSLKQIRSNERIGMVIGSSLGVIDNLDMKSNVYRNQIDFSWLLNKYHFKGEVYVISNTCVSGVNALAVAMSLIEQNRVDVCVVGGVDIVGDFIRSGFDSLSMISEKNVLKLFSTEQEGTILSSGAGFLVLEKNKSKKNSYGEILSCVISNDAYDVVRIDKEGGILQKTILECINKANVEIKNIDIIMTCANGLKNMDIYQANVINNLFKDYENLVSSIKPIIGHTLGASGTLDVIASFEFMKKGRCISLKSENYLDIPLSFIRKLYSVEEKLLKYALIVSIGFSGVNGAALISKGERE